MPLLDSRSNQTLCFGICSLDGILGGGFRSGEVTELCGPSGAGKTQVCLFTSAECGHHVMQAVIVCFASDMLPLRDACAVR